ncbi:MAG: hypothetical protein A3H98_13615 [Bacteroidetes bacterium RIFCSPLOWO2_02_FULL_36_8]|nr:MAG: hypothetical protein A3H98_13615 [Bacteroidetes bacterium RIFCSPLOWO2_02_FULL_36_8]OFY70859.1 MAG: hypothetical protein A3G23_12110 [Bacteroidetes bacterium RIFCSPLOWO2_12_FULL_37_12]
MQKKSLSSKKCLPCEGLTFPLPSERCNELLKKLKGWKIVEGNKIEKLIVLKNFVQSLSLLNKIGKIAEAENHHPDMFLFSYKNVRITLSTHSIGGLSENDFIVAAKIDKLLD